MWPLLIALFVLLVADLLGRVRWFPCAARWCRPRPRARDPFRHRRCVPMPRPGPVSRARRKPDWVRNEVLELAVFLRSCRRITDQFNRRHGARMTVGHTWVNELCRARAHEIAERRRAMRRRAPRQVAPRHAWALDLTFFSTADGRQQTTLGIIDCGSRLALALQVLPSKCTWTLLGHVCLAIARYGRPATVKTDNEPMFTSRLWREAFAWAGIGHSRIERKCPWQNGRIERFFGTLKPVLRQLMLPDALALQRAADEFCCFYNEVRTHRSLGGLTPWEAWSGTTWHDLWRRGGSGRWVHAFDGLLIGYHSRC